MQKPSDSSLRCSHALQCWVRDEFWQALPVCVYSVLFLICRHSGWFLQAGIIEQQVLPIFFLDYRIDELSVSSIALGPHNLKQGLSFNWKLAILVSSCWSVGSHVLSVSDPQCWGTSTGSLVDIFTWNLGTWTQVFKLTQQAIFEPSPKLQHIQFRVNCCYLNICIHFFPLSSYPILTASIPVVFFAGY